MEFEKFTADWIEQEKNNDSATAINCFFAALEKAYKDGKLQKNEHIEFYPYLSREMQEYFSLLRNFYNAFLSYMETAVKRNSQSEFHSYYLGLLKVGLLKSGEPEIQQSLVSFFLKNPVIFREVKEEVEQLRSLIN